MNRAYISKLLELAEKDNRICHLVADSGTGFDEMFRHNYPNQMYNFGIAENNMVGVAAGMSMIGEIPFVFTADAFLVYRSLEFIRDDICLQNLNVKIIGMGNGVSWSSLGPTHHTTEAISVLRAMPNLVILNPSTPYQVSKCVEYAYKYKGPVYIRMGMNNEKEFYTDKNNYEVTQNYVFGTTMRENIITIFTTGSILEEVLKVKDMIEQDEVGVKIVDCTLLKPFNENIVVDNIKQSRALVSIEEHNIEGGLGSIIADVIVKNNLQYRLYKIGLNDEFAKSFGTLESVRKANGLDAKSMYNKIKELI